LHRRDDERRLLTDAGPVGLLGALTCLAVSQTRAALKLECLKQSRLSIAKLRGLGLYAVTGAV
jgi:hypothetical protein